MATSTETTLKSFVINEMDKETYEQLLAEGKINDDEMYLVEDDNCDISFYIDENGILTAVYE